ncbi:Fic family protein [Rubrobacter tropicus]|uniref:Fic family protein n=1 Tax=Rubrobacter tropicus TaxID=2653851 RepID=A0A6G8Q6J8_9ACTN|nr:Fic family protein [Rubrobacter tropicus]QIN82048.1 Fic family protein [Rubrobacter tropicus]
MQTEQRTYGETHPWITFRCDTDRFPTNLWMNLGEARSECESIARTPLLPEVAKELHTLYVAKGVLATAAIEGNTLTEEQVRDHLEGKLELPPSREYLRKEVQNIVDAINSMAGDTLKSSSVAISVEEIKDYNLRVLDGLELDEDVVPGEFRTGSFGVGRYRGAPAEDLDYLMQQMCDWLNHGSFCMPEEQQNRVVFGLLRAILAHLYIAWIHPFGDGNGRTARLVEFKVLIAAGVPSPACQLLSNHYNLTRNDYYRQLDRASRSGGDIVPFIVYAMQGFVDGLHEQMNRIWDEQMEVVWRNFVHDAFSDKGTDKESTTAKRRRHLLLDLSEVSAELLVDEEWVDIRRLDEVSVRVAKEYASLTHKTLRRDLTALQKMELVEVKGGSVRARRERITAFLPLRRDPNVLPEPALDGLAQVDL